MQGQVFNEPRLPRGTYKDATPHADHANGYLYVFEAGSSVKIGKTVDPVSRLANHRGSLRRVGVEMGRFWLSPQHGNYSETESELMKLASGIGQRAGAGREYFSADFDAMVEVAEGLCFKYYSPAKQRRLATKDRQRHMEFMRDFMPAVLQFEPPNSIEPAGQLRRSIRILLSDPSPQSISPYVRDLEDLDRMRDEIANFLDHRYEQLRDLVESTNEEDAE